jgi:deoxyribodipyrimidine photo-lyase
MQDATPSREAGLARIAAFRPAMGRAYAAERNHDRGPDDRGNVSGLSPWIRRRLVLEEEAIAAALGAHGAARAEKFVEEVAWRGYFKGWLERRPSVWADYRAALPGLRGRFDARPAEEGRTGIAPFDAWARELVATGYLHNHARMWFASIWIFTLRLPWELGADFFLRHLLDGDPASNTCSWRWVAGLHTPGKTYAARSSNIARFTDGRFGPVYGLAPDPAPVPGGNPAPGPLRAPRAPDPAAPFVRLILEDDCRADANAGPAPLGVATVRLTARRSDRPVAAAVADWDRGALADAAARLGGATAFEEPAPEAVADWAAGLGARQVVTEFVPVGWTHDWAEGLEAALKRRGMVLAETQRPWDATLWPHAGGGFFGVRKKLPAILARVGL